MIRKLYYLNRKGWSILKNELYRKGYIAYNLSNRDNYIACMAENNLINKIWKIEYGFKAARHVKKKDPNG